MPGLIFLQQYSSYDIGQCLLTKISSHGKQIFRLNYKLEKARFFCKNARWLCHVQLMDVQQCIPRRIQSDFFNFQTKKPIQRVGRHGVLPSEEKISPPRKTSLICQDHFKEEDFYPSKPSSKIKRLKRHAVPSIFQFPAGVGPRKVSARSTRTSMAAAGILDCKDDRDIFLKKSASGNNHNDSPYSSKQGSVKETDKATKVRWKAEWNFTAYDTFLF